LIRRLVNLRILKPAFPRLALLTPAVRRFATTRNEDVEEFPEGGREQSGRGARGGEVRQRFEYDATRSVYVSGFPSSWTSEQLQKHLDAAGGNLENVSVLRNRTPSIIGRALIQCKNTETQQALLKRKGEVISEGGRELTLGVREYSPNPQGPTTKHLVVLNLPFATGEEELQALASKYGEVERVRIPRRKEDNASRGIAFITFKSEEDGKGFLEKVNNMEFQGRNIRVSIREPDSQRRNPRGGNGGNFR
jgi:RNA recognition motif-containing protein